MSKYTCKAYKDTARLLKDAKEHFQYLENIEHHIASSEDVISYIRDKLTLLFVADNPHFHESTFFIDSGGADE